LGETPNNLIFVKKTLKTETTNAKFIARIGMKANNLDYHKSIVLL
jgi:hypothetical protein